MQLKIKLPVTACQRCNRGCNLKNRLNYLYINNFNKEYNKVATLTGNSGYINREIKKTLLCITYYIFLFFIETFIAFLHATLQPDKKWLLLHRNELFAHKKGCTRILKQVATATFITFTTNI